MPYREIYVIYITINFKTMDKFNNLSANQAEFMTISFFADRFGIRKEFLEWGLEKVIVDDATHYFPILKIDGMANAFIDIQRDKISLGSDTFGKKTCLLNASMKEENDSYIFSSAEKQLSVSKAEMKKLYEGKFLTPETLE